MIGKLAQLTDINVVHGKQSRRRLSRSFNKVKVIKVINYIINDIIQLGPCFRFQHIYHALHAYCSQLRTFIHSFKMQLKK